MSSLLAASPEQLNASALETQTSISKGHVAGATVTLSFDGDMTGLDQLALAVTYADGRLCMHELPRVMTAATISLDIDSQQVVEKMLVFGVRSGKLLRIPQIAENYHLDRVLSRDIEQINKNIRWHGRIDDFSSRVFAAMNSFRHLKPDVNLAAYCLVSIGYTALERNDETVACQVYDELRAIFWNRRKKLHGEALFSFLTHLMHHAMYFRNPSLFENVARVNYESLNQVKAAPISSFNAIVSLLLSAIYYYEAGMLDRALEHFSKGDGIFRIAAAGYPRDLVKFRELTTICNRSYIAQIGATAASGAGLRPELGIKMFHCESVAGEVSRLYGTEQKKSAGRWLMALAKIKRERITELDSKAS